ncbi:MAG: hypothetical protein M3Y21_04040 [Candidatus Eremiobacteraeota bacterium]|nr:hypothetical protein [Candidatus Eremiobacteraeota bacterium]
MTKHLEELDLGTPVFCEEEQVGEVRGVFTIGESRMPEYLSVYWNARSIEVLLGTDEVLTIDGGGVQLQSSFQAYADLPPFEHASRPNVKRLR